MTDHHPSRQAFRQFQYLTLPLHVPAEHIEQAWRRANERVAARLIDTEA
jgi:hypothetical protein